MQDLSLHILDIVENSISAEATTITISVVEDYSHNILTLEIADNGKGMSKELLTHACDPFYTTRTTRNVGLGIPLLAQAARESNGDLSVNSKKGEGTEIRATFQYDHIDRKPLGDIEKTLIVLIASNPETDFIFEHRKGNNTYFLNTREIKRELDGVPINTPEVIQLIKDDITAWLNDKNNMIQ